MPSRICIHYARKSGRPSSGHRTGKGQSSSQFPRRVLPKNVLTIKQLHSSLKLVWSYLKSCMLGFSIMQTKNFQMSSWVSKRKRNFRDHIANVRWVIEKAREFQKNISLCSSATLKPLTVWIMTNCGKLLDGSTDHLICLLRNLCAAQEATARTLYGTTD